MKFLDIGLASWFWCVVLAPLTRGVEEEHRSSSSLLRRFYDEPKTIKQENPLDRRRLVTNPSKVIVLSTSTRTLKRRTRNCGGGTIGNGMCTDSQLCCSPYGYCGTGTAYCGSSGGGGSTSNTTHTSSSNRMMVGYYEWTWSSSSSTMPPLANATVAVAFSGWANVQKALQASKPILPSLQQGGAAYISIGGGNANGRWTSKVISQLNRAITKGNLKSYTGIVYDVEEGDSGLSHDFAKSFATAKQHGLHVIVTVSHSAPYGIADASALMTSFFGNKHHIDAISPQLYSSGKESANQYSTSHNVSWSQYQTSHAPIVPSIVQASYYPDAQAYFLNNNGITLGGFIQWAQS